MFELESKLDLSGKQSFQNLCVQTQGFLKTTMSYFMGFMKTWCSLLWVLKTITVCFIGDILVRLVHYMRKPLKIQAFQGFLLVMVVIGFVFSLNSTGCLNPVLFPHYMYLDNDYCCISYSLVYSPFMAQSSSWLPCSVMLPFFITMILSAWRMVLKR